MHTEAPVCTRCGFCLPLRYGLIVWGYLKLVIGSLLFLSFCSFLNFMINTLKSPGPGYKADSIEIVIIAVFLILAVVDIVLTITYIIACHKKNVKLLNMYKVYSIVLTSIMSGVNLFGFILSLIRVFSYDNDAILHIVMFRVMDLSMFFAFLALQVYIILLIRSEIVKLENRSQCSFVNNAAEAECNLRINNCNGEQESEKDKKGVDDED